ncbi:MAG: redoxin domain-containing protein [Bacteroidetes bacterium]|nr:redoxin domain-containing protein [Bacteroidota bacterium]
MRKLITFLLSFLFCSLAVAQNVDIPLLAVQIDGAPFDLKKDTREGLVLFFTSSQCPFDDHYFTRLRDLNQGFKNKIGFYFINASFEDTRDEIRKQMNEWGNDIPYLLDEGNIISKALMVKRTTECILLKRNKTALSIFYRGPIDDNPQVANDADHEYLEEAIKNLLEGRENTANSARVAGCLIRDRY